MNEMFDEPGCEEFGLVFGTENDADREALHIEMNESDEERREREDSSCGLDEDGFESDPSEDFNHVSHRMHY